MVTYKQKESCACIVVAHSLLLILQLIVLIDLQ